MKKRSQLVSWVFIFGFVSVQVQAKQPPIEEQIEAIRQANSTVAQSVSQLLLDAANANAPEDAITSLPKRLQQEKTKLQAIDSISLQKELRQYAADVDKARRESSGALQSAYADLISHANTLMQTTKHAAEEQIVLSARVDALTGEIGKWVTYSRDTASIVGTEAVRRSLKEKIMTETKAWGK